MKRTVSFIKCDADDSCPSDFFCDIDHPFPFVMCMPKYGFRTKCSRDRQCNDGLLCINGACGYDRFLGSYFADDEIVYFFVLFVLLALFAVFLLVLIIQRCWPKKAKSKRTFVFPQMPPLEYPLPSYNSVVNNQARASPMSFNGSEDDSKKG